MSANAIVWWATLVALIVVLALAGRQAARALSELKRAKARLAGFEELPVFKALERAEADAQRLQGSLEQVAPLLNRAEEAMALIRRGPIPSETITAAKRVGAEFADLRAFAGELRSR